MITSRIRGLLLVALIGLVADSPAAIAQTTWTGLAAPDNTWVNSGNWDTGVPGSGNTATFNSDGNGNTSISLGGAAQPIGSILFDTVNAASYTLGALSSGDQFNFDAGGAITENSTVADSQTINADIQAAGLLTITNSSTTAPLVLAGKIGGSGSITYAGPGSGSTLRVTEILGQNTYSGDTTINVNANTIQIGSSSNSGPFTSGPFGTGAIVINSSTQSPLQAINADQVVANQFNLLHGGFTVTNATTPYNLTLTGPINLTDTNSRTISINNPGQTLTLGASPGSNFITLSTGAAGNKNLAFSPVGMLVMNDVIRDDPISPPSPTDTVSYNTITGTTGAIIQLNTANTYAGNTTLATAAAQFEIGVDTDVPFGTVGSGPFGAGTLSFNNSGAPPILEAFGADRVVANAVTVNQSGFFVSNPPTTGLGADPTGTPHSLTFSGPISVTTSRVITNNLVAASTLYFGSASNPSTLDLVLSGNPLTIQTQTLSGPGGGRLIINDKVSGTGRLNIQNGAIVTLTNDNDYDGGTTLQNPGSVGSPILYVNNTTGWGTGSGLVTVTTGILAGTGFIVPYASPVDIGQVTIGSEGVLAPGTDSIGTLTFDSTAPAGPILGLTAGATVSAKLNTSLQSDKVALINGSANDIVFNDNAINFTDLSGGTLGSGQYTLFSSDVAGAYSGLTLDGSNNITAGLMIGSGLSAYPMAKLMVVGNDIDLVIPASSLPGDYNQDGVVNAADYVTWRKAEGGPNTLPNDNDLGFPIDSRYYDLWRTNFGNTAAGGGAALGNAASVPEPTTLTLICLAVALTLAWRCGR